MEGSATEADPGRIEVRVSTWKYVIELGMMASLFLFSALLVGIGLIERDSGFIRDLMMTVMGLIGIPLSAVACHNVLRLLRDSRPALQVTDEGILNRTMWASATVVPWEEIVEMSPFPLFLSQLDAAPDDVTRELIEAVEARELAAIRESKRIEASTDPEGSR